MDVVACDFDAKYSWGSREGEMEGKGELSQLN